MSDPIRQPRGMKGVTKQLLDGTPEWCNVVHMNRNGGQVADTVKGETRLSVTLSKEDHDQVCRMAKIKKVSAAWIIRDAVEKYLLADAPLLQRYK